MDITNPFTQVTLQQANTIAGRLIGIFANHNAHHAIMQHTKLKIASNFSFKLNGYEASSLHNIKAFDGSDISRNNAGFLAAAVDAVKDPVLKYLNLNDFTADIAGMLSRAGYSPDTIGLLLNQPIILDITKEYFNSKKQGISKNVVINNIIEKYKKNADVEINTINVNKNFLNKDLANNIAIAKRVLETSDIAHDSSLDVKTFYNNQLDVAFLFLKMQEPALALANAVAASRADTSGGGTGPTHADTINKLNKTSDYLASVNIENPVLEGGNFILENIISNINHTTDKKELFNAILNSPLPINQAFYTLGLETTKTIMGKYFPHFKPEFMYIVDKLRSFTTYNKLDE
jgi:hypothetical protein